MSTKILVIDDDPNICEMVRLYLENEGYEIKTAADGVKGYYPAFDLTPPSLISGVVTDLGIYSPYDLKRYLEESDLGPYEMVI